MFSVTHGKRSDFCSSLNKNLYKLSFEIKKHKIVFLQKVIDFVLLRVYFITDTGI